MRALLCPFPRIKGAGGGGRERGREEKAELKSYNRDEVRAPLYISVKLPKQPRSGDGPLTRKAADEPVFPVRSSDLQRSDGRDVMYSRVGGVVSPPVATR